MKQKIKTNTSDSKIATLNNEIEQKDATIVTLSLELSELKNKYNHQSKRLGGFVQSNKNYKKSMLWSSDNRARLNSQIETLKGDLKIMSNRLDDKNIVIEKLRKEAQGLKIDIAAAETNYELEYRKAKDLHSQLQVIRSKWWFWLFNW